MNRKKIQATGGNSLTRDRVVAIPTRRASEDHRKSLQHNVKDPRLRVGLVWSVSGLPGFSGGFPRAGRLQIPDSMNAKICEGKSDDVFPADFFVFPGDSEISFGRLLHKIPPMWPVLQLLNPRGLTDPSPLSLAVSPENSGGS
jgi:hypothetical protein